MSENKSLITEVDILDEAKEDFLVYAEETLTDRAVPAAEDGLLSAQRKILWTMHDYLGMTNKSKTKKCNGIVGSTLVTSYFHGDISCYGVLCKLSQEYLMRYPLITGQGMLGTQEDNSLYASSRYTEGKPSIYADLLFNDFKKNVVPLKETYNGEYMEPVILPSFFPNAICNGKEAIGVSLAHNSLSHNLTEACNAIIRYIKQGNLTIDELLEEMPGPDFPLGGSIINTRDVREAYLTGKSKVSLKVRGDYEIDGNTITFVTIPYRTYRNKIKEQIEKNIDKLSEVITDFDDLSNLGDNKLVFTTTNPDIALQRLFALTDLQTTLSYNMNYIVNGTPKLCSMLDLIEAYATHQENVLIKAIRFDKDKAEARAHILKALVAAVDKIDEVLVIIKSSKDKESARRGLMEFLDIDETQANAILDMRLGKLTRIDKDELINELEEKLQFLIWCNKILENKDERSKELIKRVTELRDKYGDKRRTKLLNLEIKKEEKERAEIIPEDCVVVVTETGLIKRIPTKSFRTQRRNTVGIKNGDDVIAYTVKTNTLDTLMVFSSLGKMYRVSVDTIPEGTNVSRGVSLRTLTNLTDDEIPMAYSSLKYDTSAKFVFFATKNGIIKKSPLKEYQETKRKTGIIALNLREGDSLASVTFIENEEMLLVTRDGNIIRFETNKLPISSRTSQGVKGIDLKEGNQVIKCLPIHKQTDNLAIVAATGLGKQIALTEIPTQNRGGRGVSCYKGEIVGAELVDENDYLLINGNKTSIKIAANEIPTLSRVASGNSLIKNNEKVVSVVKI